MKSPCCQAAPHIRDRSLSVGDKPIASTAIIRNDGGGSIYTVWPATGPAQRREIEMKKALTMAVLTALMAAGPVAAESVKVGYMTTLSGGAGIIGKQMQNAV